MKLECSIKCAHTFPIFRGLGEGKGNDETGTDGSEGRGPYPPLRLLTLTHTALPLLYLGGLSPTIHFVKSTQKQKQNRLQNTDLTHLHMPLLFERGY